jgi:hypothetical protein
MNALEGGLAMKRGRSIKGCPVETQGVYPLSHVLFPLLLVSSWLIWLGGALGMSADFRKQDTTPPTVSTPQPPPNMTVSGSVTISAKFADTGSGVDISSARVLLDGKDVTRQTKVTGEGFTLHLKEPLAKGIHRVEASVSDKTGNKSNRLNWRFGVDGPVPVEARFEGELFLVNGEPFFPMGIYNYSCMPDAKIFKEAILSEATLAGFNVLLWGPGSKEGLDVLLKHGMKALLGVTLGVQESTDREKAKELLVEKGAVRFKDHPAVLGYWADSPDATFYHAKVPKGEAFQRMRLAYETIKEHDPHHPVIWCFAHRDTFKDYISTSDALMTFYYPVRPPELGDLPITSISDIMIQPAKEAAGKKQVWFISQAIDLSLETQLRKPSLQEFRPTPQEMRAMNYLALVEGVKGLIIYASGGSRKPGLYNNLVKYPDQWREALKIASEVRYLSPALAEGKETQTVNLSPEEATKAVRFREIEHEGRHYLIAVNVTKTPAQVTWRFPQPVQPSVLFEDRLLAKRATKMTDTFKPYEVHIYAWE